MECLDQITFVPLEESEDAVEGAATVTAKKLASLKRAVQQNVNFLALALPHLGIGTF
jgi:hypothetical protein